MEHESKIKKKRRRELLKWLLGILVISVVAVFSYGFLLIILYFI